MWNIIYDISIKQVFQHNYQTTPLDYASTQFYHNRKDKILQRLDEISKMDDEEVKREVEKLWDLNYQKHNRAIDWDSINFSKHKLMDIAYCMGGQRLSLILKNYWTDYKNSNHGMPDLFLWNPNTKECIFSEVKSENDELRDVQKGWIWYLTLIGFKVEVWYVNRASKKGKQEAVFE